MTGRAASLVDAHVHGHGCFPLAQFLACARANVLAERARRALPADGADILLLAEGAGEDFFTRCRALAGTGAIAGAPGWSIAATGEPNSLRATHTGASSFVMIAGRQIATMDRIELIGIGLADGTAPPDGLGARETLDALTSMGTPAILPWGFGKWTFRRGRLVRSLLESADPRVLFVGDNGGRAASLPRPRLLEAAERLGFRDLPGSDPLPFPAHVRRVASRGFLLPSALDAARPAADLAARLALLAGPPERYGCGRPLAGFMADQVKMQARRFTSGRSAS